MFKDNNLQINENFLWQSFKNGSEKAFEMIYDKYFSRLYKYGIHVSSNKDLVKDCIQNLFFELWKNKETISDVANPKSYLITSLRRKIIKEILKENKFSMNEISENYSFLVNASHEHFMIMDQDNEDINKRLNRAFKTLTKRQKEAIFLKFYENMEYIDIAGIMSLKSAKYARTLIYRALDVLKISIVKEEIY